MHDWLLRGARARAQGTPSRASWRPASRRCSRRTPLGSSCTSACKPRRLKLRLAHLCASASYSQVGCCNPQCSIQTSTSSISALPQGRCRPQHSISGADAQAWHAEGIPLCSKRNVRRVCRQPCGKLRLHHHSRTRICTVLSLVSLHLSRTEFCLAQAVLHIKLECMWGTS